MKEDLKYKILKASLDLLEEGDVSALSMREVARRAGVSHQAPYHYFADREAILAELVRDGFERLHQDETSAVDAHDDQKDKIAALGESYVQFALENPSLFRLMFRCDMVDLDKHPDAKAAANKKVPQSLQTLRSLTKARTLADSNAATKVEVLHDTMLLLGPSSSSLASSLSLS